MQCAVSAGAALDMWIGAQGAGGMVQAACPEHSKPDHHSSHNHEHCLLCNTAVGDCPTPVLPTLSLARAGAAVPAATPDDVAYRKPAYANTARGPPVQA